MLQIFWGWCLWSLWWWLCSFSVPCEWEIPKMWKNLSMSANVTIPRHTKNDRSLIETSDFSSSCSCSSFECYSSEWLWGENAWGNKWITASPIKAPAANAIKILRIASKDIFVYFFNSTTIVEQMNPRMPNITPVKIPYNQDSNVENLSERVISSSWSWSLSWWSTSVLSAFEIFENRIAKNKT